MNKLSIIGNQTTVMSSIRKNNGGVVFRKEKDALGFVEVPNDMYYGAQTQRSLINFPIAAGKDLMPIKLIHALALVKKAAACINKQTQVIPNDIAEAIMTAADEVNSGKLDSHFPLVIWQTGSGTQTNMNMNEVIGNRAAELLGGGRGDKQLVHPNDHVNRGQSSNDIFPTAMNVSVAIEIKQKLLPAMNHLLHQLTLKQNEYWNLVKIGRTHMQDAVPMTVGQELSGYASQLHFCIKAIEHQLPSVCQLAVGGTAVGTGLNSTPNFDVNFCETLSDIVFTTFENTLNDKEDGGNKLIFKPDHNKFAALAGHDALLLMSGCLNTTAAALLRLANDFRLLASGPRCGFGEFILPSNEPGSSIMPGKVNPTQCESLSMVCVQVMGNHFTTSLAASQGYLELNVYKPVLVANILHSIELLGDSCRCFADNAIKGLTMNKDQINEHVQNSLMLVTALNPVIGYDKAAEVALYAHNNKLSLKEAVLKKGYLTEKEFDAAISPINMAFPFQKTNE